MTANDKGKSRGFKGGRLKNLIADANRLVNADAQILYISFCKYMILLNIFNWQVNLTMHEEAVTPLQQ